MRASSGRVGALLKDTTFDENLWVDTPEYADVMTIDEWKQSVHLGIFNEDDGVGYWVRADGKMLGGVMSGGWRVSGDLVFGDPPELASGVAWFNK